MVLASITDSLVHLATNAVDSLGLAGIFVLMLGESACIPIPSEATMLFAGFGVSQGRFSLLAITIAGVAGNLVGSWVAYGLGYYGRMELVERHARKLHIKPSHIAWADRWFSRWGEATVFFTRCLPIIRTFISLPAGIARMPFVRFTMFTLLGCIPWVFMLAFVGEQVGHNWTKWKGALSYVDYVVVASVVGGIGYLIVRRLSARRVPLPPPARSGPYGDEHQIPAAEQNGAHAEHQPGLRADARDSMIASHAAVSRVESEQGGHTAEVPGKSEEQRDKPERDAEGSEQTGERRAASVEDGDRDIDDGDGHSFGGSRESIA